MECNAVRNSPEANPSAAEEKSGWDRVRSIVLRRGWNVAKKVAIVGAVVSSAPVVIPPLLFFSTLGFAVAFPFGVYFASFACTDLLMRSFLGLSNGEHEEEEFFVPEEEMESEGDKEEEEIVWQLELEEKGNGGMVEEEEKQREEAGMGEGKEVAEDKEEEERGGGRFPYDVNLVPLVLVYPDDKYPSDVYDGWIRGDIATEEQLMEEMKMREEIQEENEKDQEILVSSQYPSAAEDGGATLGAESGGEEKTEEEVGGGEQKEAEAEEKEEVGLDAATLKSEESLRSDDEELEEREVEVAPSSEYASDAKDGGVRGDVGLVGSKWI